jgi:hypothetical protein
MRYEPKGTTKSNGIRFGHLCLTLLVLITVLDWMVNPIALLLREVCIDRPQEIHRETLSPKANSGNLWQDHQYIYGPLPLSVSQRLPLPAALVIVTRRELAVRQRQPR